MLHERWRERPEGGEDIKSQSAIVGSGFNHYRLGNGQIPHPAGKLARQQFPEQGSNRHAGKEVACSADSFPTVFIETEAGRVEGQFHEPGEGNESPAVCLLLNQRGQRVVALGGVLVSG